MKIETLTIKNFRCFGPEPETLSLESGVTAMVGGNGAGKTAALQALARLFGVSSAQRQIQKRDFHLRLGGNELVSGATLVIECVLSFPELDGLDDDVVADSVPDFFNHMAATGPGEPLKARIRLQATWTDDGTPDGTVEEDIRWIGTLDNHYVWDECQRVAAVDRGTIQLVYVPATRNPADRVTDLLKGRLWRAAKWSDRMSKTTERGAKLIQKRFEREGPSEFIVERLTKRWQQVHEADTDTTPVLRLVESRLEALVRNVEFAFLPDEAGRERALADLSDGQRSLFHIALTAATLETERDSLRLAAPDSPFDQEKLRRAHLTILAIEEPENSLSPFFLSRIMNQARDIAALESAQVLISSHSASILSRIEPDEVRYFRLDRNSRSSSVKSLTLPEDATEAGKYVRLAVRAYPELYFARFVILGEGDSERIVLPLLADAMGIPLDPSFVPVVPLGGRHVEHFWRLLDALQIPHATLLDLDLGRAHGGANMIRATVDALASIGNDLSDNFDALMWNSPTQGKFIFVKIGRFCLASSPRRECDDARRDDPRRHEAQADRTLAENRDPDQSREYDARFPHRRDRADRGDRLDIKHDPIGRDGKDAADHPQCQRRRRHGFAPPYAPPHDGCRNQCLGQEQPAHVSQQAAACPDPDPVRNRIERDHDPERHRKP